MGIIALSSPTLSLLWFVLKCNPRGRVNHNVTKSSYLNLSGSRRSYLNPGLFGKSYLRNPISDFEFDKLKMFRIARRTAGERVNFLIFIQVQGILLSQIETTNNYNTTGQK